MISVGLADGRAGSSSASRVFDVRIRPLNRSPHLVGHHGRHPSVGARVGYNVDFYPSVDDRGRALLYLGIALLAIVAGFLATWALATYYPWDYGAQTLFVLILLPFMILGVYAAFRFRWLRYPQ